MAYRQSCRAPRLGAHSLAMLLCLAACAGADLPDAPDPPHRQSVATLAPGGDPTGGSPTGVPDGLRGGTLVTTSGGFLEFVRSANGAGRTVIFAFPYDSTLSGLKVQANAGKATYAIDGGKAQAMTGMVDQGELFFYAYPTLPAGSHSVAIAATVGGSNWNGTFSTP